jgi:hypothetical protein
VFLWMLTSWRNRSTWQIHSAWSSIIRCCQSSFCASPPTAFFLYHSWSEYSTMEECLYKERWARSPMTRDRLCNLIRILYELLYWHTWSSPRIAYYHWRDWKIITKAQNICSPSTR